jgi:hypothetical protein
MEYRPRQSGLMLAARITVAHFSVSSAMSFPNSAGVIGIGAPAEFDETCLKLGIGEARIDLPVQRGDDLGRNWRSIQHNRTPVPLKLGGLQIRTAFSRSWRQQLSMDQRCFSAATPLDKFSSAKVTAEVKAMKHTLAKR